MATAASQLTCAPGTWTGSPTFTYVWDRDGTPITGAASSTYTVTTTDQGHTWACVVTATNAGGQATATSAGVAAATPATLLSTSSPVALPTVVSAPTVSGTPLPGDALTCNPGTWTGSPTLTYQWVLGTAAVTGATTDTYTVTILDEGQTITCTVYAKNATGTQSGSSSSVVVAQKGTLKCPKPSGAFTAAKVGPLALGMSRSRARKMLTRYAITHYGFDDFCLYGG